MFSLKVALRYLFSKKSRNAVNVISVISVLGVAVATAAIVCVMSVFNGFGKLAESHIASITPQVRVSPAKGKVIENADSLMKIVVAAKGVECATILLEEQALAIYNGLQLPVRMIGVDSLFAKVTGFDKTIIDGDYLLVDSAYQYASLSVGVANRLQAHPSYYQYVGLYTPRRTGRINPANPAAAFRADSLIVSSVFETDALDYDAECVVVPIASVRRMLDYEGEASAIGAKIAANNDETAVITALASRLGPDYVVNNRLQQHSDSFRMIEVEKWITFLLLAFILVIASFNVISTLSMIVVEKDPNIHTMKALGASRRQISRIFFIEGWIISAAGGVLGIIFGLVLCLLQEHYGLLKLSGDASMMTVDAYPVVVKAIDIIAILLLTIVIGWVTSYVTSLFTRRRY